MENASAKSKTDPGARCRDSPIQVVGGSSDRALIDRFSSQNHHGENGYKTPSCPHPPEL